MTNPLENLLRHLLGTREDDTANWTQVAKLRPEDILRRRCENAKMSEIVEELKILQRKADTLQARLAEIKAEWWGHMHKAYGLPRHRNYTIRDDGAILTPPESDSDAGQSE